MRSSQNVNTNRSLENVSSNPHGWLWRVQDFSEGSFGHGGNSKRTRIRSEAWWCDWIAAISWENPWWMRKRFLWMSKESGFLGRNVFLGMMLGRLLKWQQRSHNYINLVDQAVAGFEKTSSHFERSCTISRMLSNIHACEREVVCERKSQLMQQTSLLAYLRNCHSHPDLQQPPLWSVTHEHRGETLPQAKRLRLTEG